MDPEIEELKRLVKQNLQLTQETHDMVRGMHRSARASVFFKVLYWIAILAILYGAYFYYLGPLIVRLEGVLQSLQAGGAQAQNANSQLQGILGGFTESVGKYLPAQNTTNAQ